MKRCTINADLKEARGFFKEHQFARPRRADRSMVEWKKCAPEFKAFFEVGIGWNLTDFGSEDFENRGGGNLVIERYNSVNHFHNAIGRFPTIEEDEEPWRLLVGDYSRMTPAPKAPESGRVS